jgi:hypothetical protein
MPPLGEFPRRIAPAAAMVDDFEKKNPTKTQLLPSFLTVDWRKKANNFKTQQGTSTHVLGATIPDPNPIITIPVEDISYILSYQT